MDKLPRIAWFIDGNAVRSGALVKITEPLDGEGGGILYEFGHGYSTSTIYENEADATAALEG